MTVEELGEKLLLACFPGELILIEQYGEQQYRKGVKALQDALIKEYGDGWTVGEYEITKVADKLRKQEDVKCKKT